MSFAETAQVFHSARRFAPKDDPLQLRKIRHRRHNFLPPREGKIIVLNTSRCNLGSLRDPVMRAVDVIRKKRDGMELAPSELDLFVAGATHGHWPEYQLSAMLMAIWLKGMSPAETAHLTKAMCESGKRFHWGDIAGPKV